MVEPRKFYKSVSKKLMVGFYQNVYLHTKSQLRQYTEEETAAGIISERPMVTVLICTLNEEESLPYVLPNIPEWVDEVLLVDGCSSDNTVEVAERLCPGVSILYQSGKGKGNALRYGIQRAKGDIIVTLDADGSTDPEEMFKFIEPLLNGYDFAKGSRFLNNRPNMPLHRRFGNWVLATETNLIFGTRYTDVCSGFNAFWKKSWKKVNFPDEFGYEPLITLRAKRAGLKIIEISCSDRGRISGSSKLPNWRQGWGAFKAILKERFRG